MMSVENVNVWCPDWVSIEAKLFAFGNTVIILHSVALNWEQVNNNE